MHTRRLVICGVLILLALVASWMAYKIIEGYTWQYFLDETDIVRMKRLHDVKTGMSIQEVQALLGAPSSIEGRSPSPTMFRGQYSSSRPSKVEQTWIYLGNGFIAFIDFDSDGKVRWVSIDSVGT